MLGWHIFHLHGLHWARDLAKARKEKRYLFDCTPDEWLVVEAWDPS